MKDKIVVITGANSGMGKATALALAAKGAHTVLICRNPASGEAAQHEIIQESGNTKVDLLIADLSVQKSIRELAEKINSTYPRIDVLVNNAGLALTNYSETKDGIETTFATNVLSMYQLTVLLIDKLKSAPAARIVNVSSSIHTSGKMSWEDIGFKKNYKLFSSYNQSKLANILLTNEFARRLKGTNITVNSLNPGPVKTGLARDMSTMFKLMAKLFFPSAEKASATAIYLASSPDVNGITGKYFAKCKPIASSADSMNEDIAKRLWNLCAEMTHTTM